MTPPGDPDLESLLRLAGPRAPVPAEATRRVHGAVRTAWRRALARRRRRQAMLALGAAVLLAASVVTVPRVREATPAAVPVAVVERVVGGLLLAGGAPGARVSTGDWVETSGQARAALAGPGGLSLRLDRGTRLQVVSPTVVRLERGGLYVDSGHDGPGTALEVLTREGDLRDIGTQFQVRVSEAGLLVQVRSGAVVLARDGAEHAVGLASALETFGGRLTRRAAPVHGPSWAWIEDPAPDPDLEGQTLEAFLAWASRETGLAVRFEDEGVRRATGGVRLHGSTRGMRPSEALQAVLPAAGLAARQADGVVWVRAAR